MHFIYLVFLLFSTIVHGDGSLDDWTSKQEELSYQTILGNINPIGTKRGFFAASLSTHDPNYFYTWTRDAALVARTLTLIDKTNDTLLQDYIEFQIDTQLTPTECHCLGEPKFNPDGTGFGGTWGRPQNDGPAERAITFLLISNRWLNNGYKDTPYIYNTLVPAITRDLDYITKVWYQPSFDLWEEIKGTHFYTLMVMRKALLDGIDFFHQQKSSKSLEEYKWVAYSIEHRIESFWSDQFGYILATQQVTNGVKKPSGLDVSTLLAANLIASRNDGFFTPGSDKILATAFALEESFKSLYPINQQQNTYLGTCIGRYPEDIYDGYDTSEGNPWFIATSAYTELYYLAIEEWKQVGISVNTINSKFFNQFKKDIKQGHYAPDSSTSKSLILKIQQEADKFLSTIQYHQARNGSMSEQYDKYNGFMKGARDLTWSHAATLSAIQAKNL